MADTLSTPPEAPTPQPQGKAPPKVPVPKLPEGAAAAAGAEAPPEERPAGHKIGFFQQKWVQNVLPFATSFVLHVGLIVIGYATFKVTQTVYHAVVQDQVIIPDATLAENGPPGGIVNPGTGGDPTRKSEQNLDDSVTQSEGWADKKGASLQASLTGGGAGENEGENAISIGANTAFGAGHGQGSGKGDGLGMGAGDGSGVLAPFGTPGGGGGIGPKAAFAGIGGNARKIVFLCDASGSMQEVFSNLRDELKKTVNNLVPGQFFNVIFFQNESVIPYSKAGLVMANADNKKKMYDFVDSDVSARGTTSPIPAIDAAFANKPELIYVLTDGFENVDDLESVYKEFVKLNPDKKVKVNTILLTGRDPDKVLMSLLKRIAEYTGGVPKVMSKDQF